MNTQFKEELISNKIDFFNSLKLTRDESYYKKNFNLNFHGIRVKAFFEYNLSLPLFDYFIDQSKLISTDYHLYFLDITQLWDFSSTFDNETNPDCLFQNDYIIQRDFVAMKQGNDFFVCLDFSNTDGIYNFLRYFLPSKILNFKKIFLHSSSIIENGEAFVFLGHSGAGKSTIVSLYKEINKEGIVLGDDINLLDLTNSKCPTLTASSLGGVITAENLANISYPIKAFYILNKSKTNAIRPLDAKHAAQKMLSSFNNLVVNELDENELNNVLNFAVNVSQLIPFYNLDFNLDGGCFELIGKE